MSNSNSILTNCNQCGECISDNEVVIVGISLKCKYETSKIVNDTIITVELCKTCAKDLALNLENVMDKFINP